MKPFLWKIGGEAGFGIMTTGLLFSKLASKLGYDVYDFVEYPSLIRGGHNSYSVLVSDDLERIEKNEIDYLICLNKETFELHKNRLHTNSIVVYDKDDFEITENFQLVNLPFRQFLKELNGQPIMKNTIALGASVALLGGNIRLLDEIISKEFEKKGKEIIDFNISLAHKGYDHIKSSYEKSIQNSFVQQNDEKKLMMTGNDMFAYGAVVANCNFYCAYPMTPSSTVLSNLAAWQAKTDMVVRHAEDEISVINTALGASFTGVRAAVGTSGGGFALMVESVSYAGIAEIPIVIFISQRPGPATGLPTMTEQGDLLFSVFSGHGEFPKIVLAPSDPEEMLELTLHAFDLADIYQTPVIVLSDMLLSESHYSVNRTWIENITKSYKLQRGNTINKAQNPYLRYKIEKNGISPRLIPGQEGVFYQANSYEHKENSHTTEDKNERKMQVEKRNKKQHTYLTNHFVMPSIYGSLDTARYVFVTWGSTKNAVLQAQRLLNKQSIPTAQIHFTYVHPLDSKKVKELFMDNKTYILVEQNSGGQFGRLLKMETGIDIKDKILRYDGRPITGEEIVSRVNGLKS